MSPLVQLRYIFRGFDQHRTIRATSYQDDQDYPALGLMFGSPHILTTIQSAHFYRTGPGLS